VKFLIAGYGSIGRRHLNNLIALGEKDVLLLRSHHSTLQESEIASFPVETSIEAALTHRPDAVIIANPTALHLDVAIPVAQAGCAILMEKPISHSWEHIPELKKALKESGAAFLTGFQYRFHPGLRQVKTWLMEGRVGQVTTVKSHWGEYMPGWHPWEDYRNSYSARADLGGGVVNTLCHPFDYLRWLFGEVSQLSAYTSNQGLNLDVEDTADVLLQFSDGPTANVHLDYIQRPGQHVLWITGTTGSIHWDNTTGKARYYDIETKIWHEVPPPPDFERNHLFLAEMAHFLSVVCGEETSACTLEDGLAALAITDAVHRSARDGVILTLARNEDSENRI
jgi:predicted dehydrogenase